MARDCRAPRCLRNPGTHACPAPGLGRASICPGSRAGAAEERRYSESMTNGLKRPDPGHGTGEVGEQGNDRSCGADGGKGRNQGESARPRHAPDTGPGSHAAGGGAYAASSHEETEGETRCAPAPHREVRARSSLPHIEEGRGGRRGRGGVDGMRERTGRAPARPARPCPRRGLPGASVPAGRDSQAGRGNTTARHRGTGGQDRPDCGGGDHPCADIRAGIPRVGHGFRPGRGAHDALDALDAPACGIERRKVNWIVDADIRAFFDQLDRSRLLQFAGAGSGTDGSSGRSPSGLAPASWKRANGGTPYGVFHKARASRRFWRTFACISSLD